METLKTVIDNTYPDLVSFICIPLIISILTIALPLLSDSRHKIENRYNSDKIVDCFEKSHICRFFNIFLYIALIFIILWIFQQPRLDFKNNYINIIFENSAWLLLLIATVVLVIYLFLYISYLRKYNNPFNLFKIIQKQHSKQNDEEKRKVYFEAMSDLFYYSIQKSNEELSRSIWDFLIECFISKKGGRVNVEIIYPSEYYELIYKANGYINIKEKRVSSIFNDALMFDFLVGDYFNPSLSADSYKYIWWSIVQAIFYDDDKMIFSYWKKAHQHLSFGLKKIDSQYSDTFEITNKDEIEKRENEINEYREFHYALGALILYSEKYLLLKKCLSHTQTSPARYYLVPNTFVSLFLDYINLKDDYKEPFYYGKYNFPDIDGVNSFGIVLMWIRRYFAILFLRQYGVADIFSSHYYKPSIPNLPNTLAELSTWKDKIEVLRDYTKYYITEKTDILDKLDLSYLLNSELLNEKKQESPLDFLSDFIEKITTQYNQIKKEQPLSVDKVKLYTEKTVSKITDIYNRIIKATNTKYITNPNILGANYIGLPRYDVLTKGAFADNQDIGYFGSDSITAEAIVLEMQHYFTISFSTVVSNKYTFLLEDIFKAIDKLEVQDKDDYIIISIGIDIRHQMGYNSPSKLQEENNKYYYDSIEIVELGYSQVDFVNNSFFVLKRTDLPSLTMHDLDKNIVDKYKFELSDETHKIYTKILDLYAETSLKEEIASKYSGQNDLDESVLACVGIKYELRWGADAKAVQIQIYNSYKQVGKVNNFNDIISL